MKIVAHRGAPLVAPENTLRSISIAETLNADAVEFDVRATRDGVPVLLHDKTLDRFWGCAAPVEDVDFEFVRGLRHEASDGSINHIPTFNEVVDATSIELIIDSKATAIVPTMVDYLRNSGQLERVKFIGEPPILTRVREVLPEAQIIMSWSRPELPPQALLDQIRPFALNLKWCPEVVAAMAHLTSLGCPLWVYTIDEGASAIEALERGVSAIISNDPKTVKTALGAHKAGVNI